MNRGGIEVGVFDLSKLPFAKPPTQDQIDAFQAEMEASIEQQIEQLLSDKMTPQCKETEEEKDVDAVDTTAHRSVSE